MEIVYGIACLLGLLIAGWLWLDGWNEQRRARRNVSGWIKRAEQRRDPRLLG